MQARRIEELTMNCRILKSHGESYLADLLLAPEQAPQAAHEHLATCARCRIELTKLKDTMNSLNAWQGPEINPYFMTRFAARLREEQQRKPAGWFERLGQRVLYGNRNLRPLAATALGITLLLGGGIFASLTTLSRQQKVEVPQSATLRDLQSLDENAQVFDQLNALDQAESNSTTQAPQSEPNSL